ncbi:MAG: hypothetical protein IPK44_02360 [Candidatus Accumulibacter sp.]|uniref:hypothetical protein n=1 Tax=Accumulibacter sp. TaxID=2053492 RepID=UPI00258D95AD|nr:hypothetical protein [Accumulibacter sp.]MBK8113445.1 hypothetical protein [Accumulibacter sp.]
MTDERKRVLDTADILCNLAIRMEHVAICMAKNLEHGDESDHHAAELRGAASMVRQWSDRLR